MEMSLLFYALVYTSHYFQLSDILYHSLNSLPDSREVNLRKGETAKVSLMDRANEISRNDAFFSLLNGKY